MEAKAYQDGWFGTLNGELSKDSELYRHHYRRGATARVASDQNTSFRRLWDACNSPMIKFRRKPKPQKTSTGKAKMRVDYLDDLEAWTEEAHKIVEKHIWPTKMKNTLMNDLSVFLGTIDEAREEIKSTNSPKTYPVKKKVTKKALPAKKEESEDKMAEILGREKKSMAEDGTIKPLPGGTKIPIKGSSSSGK